MDNDLGDLTPPAPEALSRGALELVERHFAAINDGDEAQFRETAYLFDQIDGLPFERWWSGMRARAPLSVELALDHVAERISTEKEPHAGIWIAVSARSSATGQTYADRFVVWYLLRSRTWKLGCRIHWGR